MATFTYQLAYWGWVKLEKDEVKAERTGMRTFFFDRAFLKGMELTRLE